MSLEIDPLPTSGFHGSVQYPTIAKQRCAEGDTSAAGLAIHSVKMRNDQGECFVFWEWRLEAIAADLPLCTSEHMFRSKSVYRLSYETARRGMLITLIQSQSRAGSPLTIVSEDRADGVISAMTTGGWRVLSGPHVVVGT